MIAESQHLASCYPRHANMGLTCMRPTSLEIAGAMLKQTSVQGAGLHGSTAAMPNRHREFLQMFEWYSSRRQPPGF